MSDPKLKDYDQARYTQTYRRLGVLEAIPGYRAEKEDEAIRHLDSEGSLLAVENG